MGFFTLQDAFFCSTNWFEIKSINHSLPCFFAFFSIKIEFIYHNPSEFVFCLLGIVKNVFCCEFFFLEFIEINILYRQIYKNTRVESIFINSLHKVSRINLSRGIGITLKTLINKIISNVCFFSFIKSLGKVT